MSSCYMFHIRRTSVFNIVNTNFYFKLIFHDMLSKLVEHLFFSPSGRNQNFPMAVEYLWWSLEKLWKHV